MHDMRDQEGKPQSLKHHGRPDPHLGDALSAPIGPDGRPVYDHVPEPSEKPEPVDVAPVDLSREEKPPVHPAASPEHANDAIHRTLRTIKWVVLAILVLAIVAGAYFVGKPLLERRTAPGQALSPSPTSVEQSNYPAPAGGSSQARSVSCLSETGPDVTTASRTFVDIAGTECVHRTGPTQETLILNGKLTGRNTEGTGMSVTLNVNGKDCNGGEALSYARTYTPMYSNCTFVVPANSSVGIKWRFLSPFGGTAAILRSSKNIAPSINGVALPKESDQP